MMANLRPLLVAATVCLASSASACGSGQASNTSGSPPNDASTAGDPGANPTDSATATDGATATDSANASEADATDAAPNDSGDAFADDSPGTPPGTPPDANTDAGAATTCQAPTSTANLFADVLGHSASDIDAKVSAAFQSLFHGGTDATVYYEVGTSQAYILDVYDNDVRTEGMSYGMMTAVELDKQDEFDRIWSWAKQYMYQSSGPHSGYFEWHRTSAGDPIGTSTNAAPDGEEYFATALIFARSRWGNGTGIFDYESEARALLDTMAHRGEMSDAIEAGVTSMFDPTAQLVVFVPNATSGSSTFTDPSYVMPAFSDVWACFDTKNAPLWQAVSAKSRAFLPTATNPTTGLAPEYAEFDGAPSTQAQKGDFRFDAWRVAMNVMTDHRLWNVDPWQGTYGSRLAAFFQSQGTYGDEYSLSGTELDTTHSAGLVAINALLGYALPAASAKPFVQELWDLPIPTGTYRYYNGMLYMLALLHASGQFRLWL
jgi:oligosaccharide reducing-end xylanase